jgi:hypothetical protein
MTLEEAILHAEEVAEENEKECKLWEGGVTEAFKQKEEKLRKCASEHRQLAEWLRELKDYKDARVGCEYCKHNYREMHERPCSLCQRNFMDMFEFEREVNANAD